MNASQHVVLLVAGARGGKTAFLRLLLDTSHVAPSTSPEQLATVAKFVQGCAGPTQFVRATGLDIIHDEHPLGLTLIDTPTLDPADDIERTLSDILRHIDTRFLDGLDEWRPDRFVHLCIYFLDPDSIVPPSAPAPPPRPRGNSFSAPDHQPVLLEPPVAAGARPTLRLADINAIRRLSARVNVLPVVARADLLSNERLAAVKLAIRRDLADAGIGFGIFDMDPPQADELPRLPYALISPDIYAHSDGVVRRVPSRHELMQQYTPGQPLPHRRFLRSYRWGSIDVLDPVHSDFTTLRTAVFHHMETLQRYTREYLFEKFRTEYRPASRHLPALPPRPVLAIDTARHPLAYPVQPPPPVPRPLPDPPLPSASSSKTPSTCLVSARISLTAAELKPRTKKITVACNFCRSRKLKCDGGRPACGQCVKRSHACDYQPQNKRRGTQRQRRQGEDSDSESGDERSAEPDEPSVSPQVPAQSLSRRSSNVSGKPPQLSPNDGYPSLPSMSAMRDDIRYGDIPHIATLDNGPPTPAPLSAPNLPPIRPASDVQAANRRRAQTIPGKSSSRSAASSGPKVVACNFCRARKTKCDGAHPACASCARRQLDCNYVHDGLNGGQSTSPRKARRLSKGESTRSVSPPSSRMVPTTPQDDMDLKRSMDYGDIRASKKMRMDISPLSSGIP